VITGLKWHLARQFGNKIGHYYLAKVAKPYEAITDRSRSLFSAEVKKDEHDIRFLRRLQYEPQAGGYQPKVNDHP